MIDEQEHHRREVRAAIERALATGLSSYDEVLRHLGGAEPRLVKEVFDEVQSGPKDLGPASGHGLKADPLNARRLSARLPLRLPAPNPMMSQWWFTLETVASLSDRVWALAEAGVAGFLGTPTVGYHYAHCYGARASILDTDHDVIECLDLPGAASKYEYSAYDPLPGGLAGLHTVVLIDPPWYKQNIELFLARARALLHSEGFILSVLPSRLTRPGLIRERTELINQLVEWKFEIVALESEAVRYRVPDFEARAYGSIPGFTGRWWRRGDLLILRAHAESHAAIPDLPRECIEVFARKPKEERFFLSPDKADPNIKAPLEPVPDFESTVSTREFSQGSIAVWGSNKKGAKAQDPSIARRILRLWAAGKTEEETIASLAELGMANASAAAAGFKEHLGLWTKRAGPSRRREPERLKHLRRDYLSDLAAEPSDRCHPYQPDDFRLDFQRDRDRVLWSHALKRLASKTQLFPVKSDDHLRRRLAHSIEVMQLASTIAVAFGLDRDLTEAGALAHDLGHAPFGHAGEYALDCSLNALDERLGGFNHYEHGVDVVRWLEDVYQSPGADQFPGLNLTKETAECIFKHTYYRSGNRLSQEMLAKATKHEDLREDVSCHLEGQAVRIADKISYLISDLEDGIRMGIIDLDELCGCSFFERPPIDIVPSPGEGLYDRFVSQRRAILKVIMEDILDATDRRLAEFQDRESVRSHNDYIVTLSDPLVTEVEEIWEKLQSGILHRDAAVKSAIEDAAKIVSDLLVVYAVAPHLVDGRFRRAHSKLRNEEYIKWYERRVGKEVGIPKSRISRLRNEHTIGTELPSQGANWMVETSVLVQAKDYVASLTDTRAKAEHRKHCRGFAEEG